MLQNYIHGIIKMSWHWDDGKRTHSAMSPTTKELLEFLFRTLRILTCVHCQRLSWWWRRKTAPSSGSWCRWPWVQTRDRTICTCSSGPRRWRRSGRQLGTIEAERSQSVPPELGPLNRKENHHVGIMNAEVSTHYWIISKPLSICHKVSMTRVPLHLSNKQVKCVFSSRISFEIISSFDNTLTLRTNSYLLGISLD